MEKWTWRSSPLSAENQTVSIFACFETILAVAIVIWMGYKFDYWMHIAISVTVAPLLLLRTNESLELGIQCVKWFDKDKYSYKNRGGRYFSGVLLAVWALVMLLLIRIYATFKAVLKLRWKAARQIPYNWRFYALCLDSFHPPETIAGIESYVQKNPEDLQLSQLTVKSLASRLINRNKNKPLRIIIFRTLVYLWIFTCLFVSSFLLRWSLKASSVVYAPFIYLSHGISFSSSNLEVRARKILNNRFSVKWAIYVVWICFTIVPVILASTIKTFGDFYSKNELLSMLLNYFTFTPHMERWNVARLLCATITIIMYLISKRCIGSIERDSKFMDTKIGGIYDGLLRSLNLFRYIGVMYLYLCGLILFWNMAVKLDLLVLIRIVLPDIGSEWFPSIPD